MGFRWLLVFLAVGVALGQERPVEKGTISGTVTDALTGVPLGKAEIRTEGPAQLLTVSDAKGVFRLVDVPAGGYRLVGLRNGYLQGKGAAITVDAGQDVSGISYKLTPFGVIAGTVRDPEGEALSDVDVSAFRVIYRNGYRQIAQGNRVKTDDRGHYRIVGLEPGRYYLVALPFNSFEDGWEQQFPKGQPREVRLPAFYPGVTEPAASPPVRLEAGERLEGIDIAVPRVPVVRVTGHVIAPPGATTINIHLSLAGEEEIAGLGPGFTAAVEANGEFVFPSVPSGNYVIVADAQAQARQTADPLELIWGTVLRTEMPLHVGNVGVQGVRIAIQPPAIVNGSVRVEGDPDASLTGKRVRFDPGKGNDIMPRIEGDQTFAAVLPPGRCAISRWVDDKHVVIRALVNGRDVMDEGLTVTGSETISVEVIVGNNLGRLEGVVSDKDGAPVSGITVVLIPEERLRWRSDLFIYVETDQKGAYRMAVPPGKYKLFAWKDVEDGAWFDPGFLRNYESKGVAVTVEPKGQATQNLTVLP